MSMWTNICAAITVDTRIEEKDLKKRMEKLLKNAPKITGSERNADVFVNVLSGYSVDNSFDCEHCQYKDTVVNYPNGSFTCDIPAGFKCPESEYQTGAVITISGSLRDRMKRRTIKEWHRFIKYIVSDTKLGWHVENISCSIKGD